VVAAAQLVSYLLYLRLSCREAVVDYIVVLTTLFWVNAVYLWHSTRLLYLLREGTVSRRSLASSRTWFYVALAYLMTTVVQAFWWLCLLDWLPLGVALAALGSTLAFFVLATRRLHKLKGRAAGGDTRAETVALTHLT